MGPARRHSPPRARRCPARSRWTCASWAAGYTGLWTAYYLNARSPTFASRARQRFAGFGASGRNGGWLTNSVTGGRGQYARRTGGTPRSRSSAPSTTRSTRSSRVAAREGIDADIVKGGELNIARTPAQLARLRAAAEDERLAGPDVAEWDAATTRSRIIVADAIGGFGSACARIQRRSWRQDSPRSWSGWA